MNCPIDGSVLLVADRSGIEIDVCPVCRGVWLDRGELNKLIVLANDRTLPRRPPSIPRARRPAAAAQEQSSSGTPSGENWLADVFEDTPPPPNGS